MISFAAASQGYGNHGFYGIVFIGLAIMALFGWMGKKKERRERLAELNRQNERDERIESLMRQQRDQVRYPVERQKVTFPNFCPSCRSRNLDDARFCAECGASLTPSTTPPVTAPQ